MYLLGSALTLVTSHPWRWLGGGAVGFVFVNVDDCWQAARRDPDGTRTTPSLGLSEEVGHVMGILLWPLYS